MSISGVQAFKAFMAESNLPSDNRVNRLYIKDDQLTYDADIGCMTLFAAKLGFGNAAMSNVSKFIKKNRATYLTDNDAVGNFNTYIDTYNDKQCICWKKARKIKAIAVQTFNPGSPTETPREAKHKEIKHHLENCKTIFNDSALEENFTQLTDNCMQLQFAIEDWAIEGNVTQDEEKTLNEVLNFKNTVRNTLFPRKDKPLKGPDCVYKPMATVNKDDKDNLRATLNGMQAQVLKKYFSKRLEADGNRLAELSLRYEENKVVLQEKDFLDAQLKKWEKRHAAGKPIAIPKWYHCTKDTNAVEAIIKTDILAMHQGAFPGVFVANLPETGTYGQYCFMLSDHIETTGIINQGQTVYPRFSKMVNEKAIKHSDHIVAPEDANFKNNQEGLGIWFGFQRGIHTIRNGWGTEGIPIQKLERIKDGALKYYEDTTLGFIFSAKHAQNLDAIGKKYRVKALNENQAEALRALINGTFFCTLPKSWQHKLQSASTYT